MKIPITVVIAVAFLSGTACSNLPPESPGGIKAYPNPYLPTSGSLTIEKTDGTQFSTTDQHDLVIYDFNLREIYRANPPATAAGKIFWSGIDTDGTKVAPGIYYLKLVSTGQTGVSNADSMFRLIIQ
jgi:hypothetical protein